MNETQQLLGKPIAVKHESNTSLNAKVDKVQTPWEKLSAAHKEYTGEHLTVLTALFLYGILTPELMVKKIEELQKLLTLKKEVAPRKV